MRRSDSGIGATLRSVLRLARHDLGERESEHKERKRAEKRRVAGGDQLGVARDSEKESKQ